MTTDERALRLEDRAADAERISAAASQPRTEGALAIAPSPPPPTTPAISRLTCHAPHPDPKKKGEDCGGLLGDVPGKYEFVTTAKKAPAHPDGYVWLRCPGGRCATWNKFRLRPTLGDARDLEVRTVRGRFEAFPERQQQAILALAGGLSIVQVARAVGVDRATIKRWSAEPDFAEMRLTLAPELGAAHVRTAFEAFFEVIEKDRQKGRAHNIRWFLSRTVFAELERSRAAARGNNVNVGVSMSQSQEQTESSIKRVWEARQRPAG